MGLGYDEVFKKIAEIGYQGVQMTYDPGNGEEVGKLLKKYSLAALGAHIMLNEIENNFDTAIGFMDNIGSKFIIIPWLAPAEVDTEEKTIVLAKRFEAAAIKLADKGYILGFHNHMVEFTQKFGDKTVMDIFFDEAPSIKFEIDTGNAYVAGADVCAVLEKFGRRGTYVHLKDIDGNGVSAEVGNGKVDMKRVIDIAEGLGIKWGIVEQDTCVNYTPFESIKVSFDYIKTIN